MPDGAVVLIDGLIASTVPALLVPHAQRLVLVVLVHLPLGDGPPGHEVADARSRECAALAAATAIITTSVWARDLLLDRYPLRPEQRCCGRARRRPRRIRAGYGRRWPATLRRGGHPAQGA